MSRSDRDCVFVSECLQYMPRERIPRVFVETGTYLGEGIETVLNSFDEIYSIELDENLTENARQRFKEITRVHVHQGDSAEVLAQLVDTIKEPAVFYLDAHYSGGQTAFGRKEDNGCPVLRELAAIGRRPYDDVVFVDDMRLMGKASYSGVAGDSIYPLTYFDFSHASYENMMRTFSKPCVTRMCKMHDRMIILGEKSRETANDSTRELNDIYDL